MPHISTEEAGLLFAALVAVLPYAESYVAGMRGAGRSEAREAIEKAHAILDRINTGSGEAS